MALEIQQHERQNAAMERWYGQNNLSHLVNSEALLGRLSGTRPQAAQSARPERDVASPKNLIPLDLSLWPRDVVSPRLRERLTERSTSTQDDRVRSLADHVDLQRLRNPVTPVEALTRLLDIVMRDVLAARDRLLMLNPGRRRMIEHRLEFIARRTARARGERLGRALSLPEVLKDSYRETVVGPGVNPAPKLSMAAWRGFVIEVSLYNVLELFFLKSLDVYGWRNFEAGDLGRMNFAAHSFLAQRAANFAHDKHCWNFVRTNLYSWYVPSSKAVTELEGLLASEQLASFSWSDRDLETWVSTLASSPGATHLEFAGEAATARLVLDLLENQLAAPLTSRFQGRVVCRKFFLPSLELGSVALSMLDRVLGQIRQSAPNAFDGGIADESSQLHRALWACESESFEGFWAEVLTLLKILRTARSNNDFASTQAYGGENPACLYRLPHALHVVNSLALELHNMEQLPLGGQMAAKTQQGSAAQIQQLEAFDGAVVTDHPDRAKSAAWMKALSQQIPYWRTLVGTSSNLNWGELHLYLALTKLKENGLCVYLSHRPLPETGDGEKLRRALLNLGLLECFVELGDTAAPPYRFLYVFRRASKKLERDQHRPRFGKLKPGQTTVSLAGLEEASSAQAEVADHGWEHLFVRGAAPLVRHLNQKFPKLFQVASLGDGASFSSIDGVGARRTAGLFAGSDLNALAVTTDTGGAMRFTPLSQAPGRDTLLIFPHNPVDLPWIRCVLSSAPAQFWIRHQLLSSSSAPSRLPRIHELRSCPIVDLSHAPADLVHEALEWLGNTKPDLATLRGWACRSELTLGQRYARFVALAKRHSSLERVVERYRPLFTSDTFEELRHEAVSQFYPAALLCHLAQSPDLRIQYAERARSSVLPENWIISGVQSALKEVNATAVAYVVVETKQGPAIQMMVPAAVHDYLTSQIRGLVNHTWGEALNLLRLPRDIALFSAQSIEIIKVVIGTAQEMKAHQAVLDELALDLFEIPTEMRQFIPNS